MRSVAIARNYAETLLALAERHGGSPTIDAYLDALDELVALLEQEPRVRTFLATPLIEVEAKKSALRATLEGRVPDLFLRFLLVVIEKRRAAHLPEIAAQYRTLVDLLHERVRAAVMLAREPDAALRREIRDSLQRSLGREVVASFEVNEDLIGGVVIRVGDQILDGSVRRRSAELRRRMLSVQAPSANGA